MRNVIEVLAEPKKDAREPSTHDPKEATREQSKRGRIVTPARVRILLVEAEMKHSDVIRRAILDDDWKAEFHVAVTLQEYRNIKDVWQPDIVLMDLNLPDGKATEVLIHPPEDGFFPVLVMTNNGSEQEVVEALKAGALDYVIKSQETLGDLPHIVARALREWELLRALKQSASEFHNSEGKFRTVSEQFSILLDAIPDSIALISPSMEILWANKATAVMSGVVSSSMVGQYCYSLLFHRKTSCENCPVKVCFQSGAPTAGYVSLHDCELEIRAVPVRGTDGSLNVIRVCRDITEHRRLESQLLQSQKMESIGVFTGGIAHDLNNILTAIMGYGEVTLMRMKGNDPHRRNINSMLECADRAAYLTKGLLAFSRKQVVNRQSVDLNTIVRKAGKLLVRVIGEDIQCKICITEGAIPVLVDGNQIEQVLMNLATNARDAMPNGGVFSIALELTSIDTYFINIHGYGKSGVYGLVTVSDTGMGMDAETRQKIFEPFFTTKKMGKGTGLGLSIIYGIIKQHDGFINVYSELGLGTMFKIYLPLISAATQEIQNEDYSLALSGKETILFIEDDASVRQAIKDLLQEFGYSILEATDGKEAVRVFNEYKDSIQLVLCDLIMPIMNGKEAYDELKKICPGIKMIFISGYTEDVIAQKGLQAEGISLLSKPLNPTVLLRRIRNVLASSC